MEHINTLFWLVPIGSFIILLIAAFLYFSVTRKTDEISQLTIVVQHLQKGIWAYLKQQYKAIALIFFLLVGIFSLLSYGLKLQNSWLPFAFILSGIFSGFAGYIGMKIALKSSIKIILSAKDSFNSGLTIAFRSGAFIGLIVLTLGLLDISFWFFILNIIYPHTPDRAGNMNLITIALSMLTFGIGATIQALFSRVGGGIFNKAANVSADIVGKIEAGIPDDDPRNPASIANNIGSNIGDINGMVGDLYESYIVSILAAITVGAITYALSSAENQMKAVIAPLLIALAGGLASVLSVFFIAGKKKSFVSQSIGNFHWNIYINSLIVIILSWIVLRSLKFDNYMGIFGSVITGLISGLIISRNTNYYSSINKKPIRNIADASLSGTAPFIISGLGTGMISIIIPVLTLSLCCILSFLFAAGFQLGNISMGLYGITMSAIGMISTIGISLTICSYGPISNNARLIAEMSEQGKELRSRTDLLASIVGSTSSIGRGYSISTTVLTSLALIVSFIEIVKYNVIKMVETGYFSLRIHKIIEINGGDIKKLYSASPGDVLNWFNINLLNPKVLIGILIGVMTTFVFSGLNINAVNRATRRIIEEIRRQFREMPGILNGKIEPDYIRCIEVSVKSSQTELIYPGLLAIFIPVIIGLITGVSGVFGLLTGSIFSCFIFSVFMMNTGAMWSNAKKLIEQGFYGGKGSNAHRAAIIGNTIGEPFKDSAGPSLNTLIKLMCMVSIVISGLIIAFNVF